MENSTDAEVSKTKDVNEKASLLSAPPEIADPESIKPEQQTDNELPAADKVDPSEAASRDGPSRGDSDSNGKCSVSGGHEGDRTAASESGGDAKRNNGVNRGESESSDKVNAIEPPPNVEQSNGAECGDAGVESAARDSERLAVGVADKSCDSNKCLSNAVSLRSAQQCEQMNEETSARSPIDQTVSSAMKANARETDFKEAVNHRDANESAANATVDRRTSNEAHRGKEMGNRGAETNVPETTGRKIIISPPKRDELSAVHSTSREKGDGGRHQLYMNLPDFSKRLPEPPKSSNSVIRDLGALRMNPPDFSRICHKKETRASAPLFAQPAASNSQPWSAPGKPIEVNHSNFSEISKKYNYVSDLQLKSSYSRPMETAPAPQRAEMRSHDLYVSRPFERVESTSLATADNAMQKAHFAYGPPAEAMAGHRSAAPGNHQHTYFTEHKMPASNYEQDTHSAKPTGKTSREMYVAEHDRYVPHNAKVNYYSHSYHEYDHQRKPSEPNAQSPPSFAGMKPMPAMAPPNATPSGYYYEEMKAHPKQPVYPHQAKQLPMPMSPSSYPPSGEASKGRHQSPAVHAGSPSPRSTAAAAMKLAEPAKPAEKAMTSSHSTNTSSGARNARHPSDAHLQPRAVDHPVPVHKHHRPDEPKRPASAAPRASKNERFFSKYSTFGAASTMIDPFIYLQSSETDLNYQIIKKTLNKEIPVPSFNRRYVQDQHSRRMESEQRSNADNVPRFDFCRKPEANSAQNVSASPRHVPTIQYSASPASRPAPAAAIENRREIYDPSRGVAGRSAEQPLELKPAETRAPTDLSMSSAVTSSKPVSPSSSLFKQPKRESPLDLSVKTVKTKADSSGQYDHGPSHRREEFTAQTPKVNFNPNFIVSSDPAHPGVISNRRTNVETSTVVANHSSPSDCRTNVSPFLQQNQAPRARAVHQENQRISQPQYRPQAPNHELTNANHSSSMNVPHRYSDNGAGPGPHHAYEARPTAPPAPPFHSSNVRYEEARHQYPTNHHVPASHPSQMNNLNVREHQADVPGSYHWPHKPYGPQAAGYGQQRAEGEHHAFVHQRKRVSDERHLNFGPPKQMRYIEPEYKNSHDDRFAMFGHQPPNAWGAASGSSSAFRREELPMQSSFRPPVPPPMQPPARQLPVEAARAAPEALSSSTTHIQSQGSAISSERTHFVTATSVITPPESRKPAEYVAEGSNLLSSAEEGKSENAIKKADQSVISKLRTSLEQKELEKQRQLKSRAQPTDDSSKTDMASLIAARIRTKGELKGFTPTPVEKERTEPAMMDGSSAVIKKPVCDFERDKSAAVNLNLNLSDWGSTCNDFLKQLQNGPPAKKQLPRSSRKSKSSDSDSKPRSAAAAKKEKASESSSSDEDEDNKPLLLLRQESLNEKRSTEKSAPAKSAKNGKAGQKKLPSSKSSPDSSDSEAAGDSEAATRNGKPAAPRSAARKTGNDSKVLTLRNKKESSEKSGDDRTEKKEKLPKKRNPSPSSDDDENDDAEKTIPAHIVKKRKTAAAVVEETMTRSKRKREIETEMANSKILRNYKVVKCVSTAASKKEMKASPTKRSTETASDEVKTSPASKRKRDSSVKAGDSQCDTETESSESEASAVQKRSLRKPRNGSESKQNDSQASDSGKDARPEKRTTPRKTPKKGGEPVNHKSSKTSVRFPPGWEKQLYEYKRSLKIPPSLITGIGISQWQHKPSSLPDLDPQLSSDASESFPSDAKKCNNNGNGNGKTKCNKKSKCNGVGDTCTAGDPKSKSIIDVLHQRVSRASLRKKSKSCFSYEPRILPQTNEAELLSTPGDKGDVFKPDNVFETSVFNSRTRREYRTLKTKEIIREVFGGEDRPASAPPGNVEEAAEDAADISQETYDQKYEQFVRKMNIDFGEKTREPQDPKIEIKTEQIDDNQNDSQDFDISSVSNMPESQASTPAARSKKSRANRHSRRKGSSGEFRFSFSFSAAMKMPSFAGFDYIRKKRKPLPTNVDGTPINVKRRSAAVNYLQVKDEGDITREIRSWVLNKGVGESYLHKAARLGYIDVIVYCLERLNMHPDQKDNAGYTPLHVACTRDRIDIVHVLLQYGANHSETAHSGIRPLHEAVESGDVEIVRLLLAYGADPLLATYAGESTEPRPLASGL